MLLKKTIKIDSDEFRDLISAQLNDSKNVELLILKGHILVEYALNKFIESFSEQEVNVDETKFTFAQKVQICEMMGLFSKIQEDNLKEQINILNKIRNQIAHKLTFDKSLLDNIYKHHQDTKEKYKDEKGYQKDFWSLHSIIPWICGNIVGRLETKINIYEKMQEIAITQIKEDIVRAKLIDDNNEK